MLKNLFKVKNYLLEVIVFTSGAVVMIFELAGSRVLGPYLGTSIFVWTSIIGIILGSLSVGYWLGGRIADKYPKFKYLASIIFFGAIFIGLTILIKDVVIQLFQELIKDVKLTSVIASIVLFTPTSILLGMVSPYAVKLKVDNLSTSGATVGNLYALSTIGSIVGTFTAGFYLIPTFGTTNILFIITMVLVFISLLAFSKGLFKARIVVLSLLVILMAATNYHQYVRAQDGFIEADTQYAKVAIWDDVWENGRSVRSMQIDNEHSSAMYTDNVDELVYPYTKYYDLAGHFNPNFKTTLMLGGAGYTYPKYFLNRYPESTIDVVEIDPKITELAKEYFDLEENPRLNIFHEDGRTYLNNSNEKYDVIYGDAFKSFIVPYQLTTVEAIQRQYDLLNDNGVVVINLISAIKGEKSQFLKAQVATFKEVFPQVYLFDVNNVADKEAITNIALVALKSPEKASLTSKDGYLNSLLKNLIEEELTLDIPVLTDDYAPVANYLSGLI